MSATAGHVSGRSAREPLEVLIVSLGSTEGLRRADEELRDSLVRAGARVQLARARPPQPTRTMMLTDLAWARAARTAALDALAVHRGRRPPTILYSSTTAALLWPRPGAIRFDATASGNRPGRHGLWQRPLERRRLREAPLLLPWSEETLDESPASVHAGDRVCVLPVPVEPSGPPVPFGERDIAAITYAANPLKKGLDRVLAAWRSVRLELAARATAGGALELVVTGVSIEELARAGFDIGAEPGVRVLGSVPAEEQRALLRRSRVFMCAPRREDYGIAQLEALADGCALVTTPAPGPYAALSIARAAMPELVDDDLRAALRRALLASSCDAAARARQLLAPFTREACDRLVRTRLLVALRDLCH